MTLLLVGLVSTPEQARELENITKLFLVGIRARKLGHDACMIKRLETLHKQKIGTGDK